MKGYSKTNPLPKKIPLTPEVWGPHYWFFLHTVAYSYPEYPTNVTKRKYYDLISNMPLFIPDQTMGDEFAKLLDKYPISPFLETRESFIRWVHYIHNKINVKLGKEEISIYKALDQYYYSYLPRPILDLNQSQTWRDVLYTCLLICLVGFMYYFAT